MIRLNDGLRIENFFKSEVYLFSRELNYLEEKK